MLLVFLEFVPIRIIWACVMHHNDVKWCIATEVVNGTKDNDGRGFAEGADFGQSSARVVCVS